MDAGGVSRRAVLGLPLGLVGVVGVTGCDIRERVLFQPPAPRPGPEAFPPVRVRTSVGDVVATHVPAPEGAPTVVYLHGNAEDREGDALLVRRFARAGLGVFLPEYPSFRGLENERPSVRRTIQRSIAAVEVLQTTLGCAPQQTVVVGYSLGAAIAAQVALARPIARLCLMAPFTSFLDIAHHHAGGLADVFVEETLETRRIADKLTMPTLLVHGSRDRLIPTRMSDEITRLAPDAERIIVPGAGHNGLFGAEGSLAFHVVVAFAKGGLRAAHERRQELRRAHEDAGEDAAQK
jgi:uncharacterized protein